MCWLWRGQQELMEVEGTLKRLLIPPQSSRLRYTQKGSITHASPLKTLSHRMWTWQSFWSGQLSKNTQIMATCTSSSPRRYFLRLSCPWIVTWSKQMARFSFSIRISSALTHRLAQKNHPITFLGRRWPRFQPLCARISRITKSLACQSLSSWVAGKAQ